MSRRTRAGSLVVLLLAVAVASCGSAVPREQASPRTTDTRPAPGTIEQPSRLQRKRFALLRTRPEGLPARLRDLVRASDDAFDPALAQRIPVLLPGGYWLAPDAGQLCVVSAVPGTPGAATTCGSTRQSLREGIATVSLTPAERSPSGRPIRLIVGVAPDGAREALVHTHGSVATVPVVRGVFVLRDTERTTSDSISLRRG